MNYETTAAVLDALRLKLRTDRDSVVARALGVSGNSVSLYRKGYAGMSIPTAMKAAQLLDEPVEPFVLERLAEREPVPEVRALWLHLGELAGGTVRKLRKAGKAAAITLIALGASLFGAPDSRAEGFFAPSPAPVTSHSLYIMSNRRRRFRWHDFATWLPIHATA